MGVRFAAIPMGHEFTSLVLALLQAGGHPPKVEAEVIEQISALELDGGDFVFETYMSLTCHNCPDVVQALNLMAVLNPRVRHVAIDGGLFQDEVEARQIMAVPTVFLNGQPFGSGRMELAEILAKVDTGAADARRRRRLAAKEAFDVLIVGGGPAGAAAAVYAARKGIRTGIVAERFGGQTLDTLGIENFISVQGDRGPEVRRRARGARARLRRRHHEQPARRGAGSGAAARRLRRRCGWPTAPSSRAARSCWPPARAGAMSNVPGEQEYKNKGVAYCPHCDGPLFKGKRVAVIGGGNSGVEAAIDLAGIVEHVTLIEFADTAARPTRCCVDKLRSLPNVDGAHQRADHRDRRRRPEGQRPALQGPHAAARSSTRRARRRVRADRPGAQHRMAQGHDRAEQARRDRGRREAARPACPACSPPATSTTVPYKQIIIASGEGSKAALSAFDHLIRMPAAAQ